MSAARRLIVEAETEGVCLYVRDGKVKVAYRGRPPCDLLAKLRAAKSQIEWELRKQPKPPSDVRAAVETLLADMAAEHERHRDWWSRPPEGWAEGKLMLRSILTGESEVIDIRKRGFDS